MIILENKKLHDLIVMKDEFVDEGRANEKVIEGVEKKIAECEKKEKEITGAVKPPEDLEEKGNALLKELEAKAKELEKIANEIEQAKLNAIPDDLKSEHKVFMKEREILERKRNKIALKVQKIKDKCVPIIKKEVKPLLNDYDDIETAKTKDGKVVIETFNYLAEFYKTHKK